MDQLEHACRIFVSGITDALPTPATGAMAEGYALKRQERVMDS